MRWKRACALASRSASRSSQREADAVPIQDGRSHQKRGPALWVHRGQHPSLTSRQLRSPDFHSAVRVGLSNVKELCCGCLSVSSLWLSQECGCTFDLLCLSSSLGARMHPRRVFVHSLSLTRISRHRGDVAGNRLMVWLDSFFSSKKAFVIKCLISLEEGIPTVKDGAY